MPVKIALVAFVVLYLLPIAISAALYLRDGAGQDWWAADRSSAKLLPPATPGTPAIVRIYAARTVRWRGVFATHCWIVTKPAGASRYTRYDYTAWGEPIRLNGFEPDGRWFGHAPDTVFAADGPAAEPLIAPIDAAVAQYAWRNLGDYRAWPGPNSNTFVSAVIDAVPGLHASLPNTAIGKDYPYDGRWLRRTPSGTGFTLTLGGYAGLTVAWSEGIELNILGAVAGLDPARLALKLPGLGVFTAAPAPRSPPASASSSPQAG